MTDELVVEHRNATRVLRLNRPTARNALNRALIDQLMAQVDAAAADASVRVLLLGSTDPRAFSSGMDVHETLDADHGTQEALLDLQWTLDSFPKPIVAALQGYVYGGGAELALSADVRIGAPKTSFRFPATGYGLIQGTWHLVDVVGVSRARELVLTGRVLEAAEAEQLGLLHGIDDDPDDRAIAVAEHLAARSAEALAAVKRLFLEAGGRTLRERFDAERRVILDRLVDPDTRARMNRFRSR